jgi:hypothetical protein
LADLGAWVKFRRSQIYHIVVRAHEFSRTPGRVFLTLRNPIRPDRYIPSSLCAFLRYDDFFSGCTADAGESGLQDLNSTEFG